MKNIHVLPTDKPSKLCFNKDKNKFTLKHTLPEGTNSWRTQNIYITSDEEIKEGDCILLPNNEIIVLPTGLSQVPLNNFIRGYSLSDCKKIILTTDKRLIKDGVQAIDNEFLEWFVKNPSCEEVKIVNNWDYNNKGFVDHSGYKIIIPKEEPKQETLEEAVETKLYQTINKIIDGGKDLQKGYNVTRGQAVDYAFEIALKVAKWQQEQDKNKYSEEEVKHLMTLAFEQGFKKADVVEAGLEAKETDTEVNWIFLKHKK